MPSSVSTAYRPKAPPPTSGRGLMLRWCGGGPRSERSAGSPSSLASVCFSSVSDRAGRLAARWVESSAIRVGIATNPCQPNTCQGQPEESDLKKPGGRPMFSSGQVRRTGTEATSPAAAKSSGAKTCPPPVGVPTALIGPRTLSGGGGMPACLQKNVAISATSSMEKEWVWSPMKIDVSESDAPRQL